MKYSATRERNWIIALISATVAIAMGAVVVMKTIHDRTYMQVEIASSSLMSGGGFGSGGAGGFWGFPDDLQSEVAEDETDENTEDENAENSDEVVVQPGDEAVAEALPTDETSEAGDDYNYDTYNGYDAYNAYNGAAWANGRPGVSQSASAANSGNPVVSGPRTNASPATDLDPQDPDNPGCDVPEGTEVTPCCDDISLVKYYTLIYQTQFDDPEVRLYFCRTPEDSWEEGEIIASGTKVEENTQLLMVAEKPAGYKMILRATDAAGNVDYETTLSENVIRLRTKRTVNKDVEYTLTKPLDDPLPADPVSDVTPADGQDAPASTGDADSTSAPTDPAPMPVADDGSEDGGKDDSQGAPADPTGDATTQAGADDGDVVE